MKASASRTTAKTAKPSGAVVVQGRASAKTAARAAVPAKKAVKAVAPPEPRPRASAKPVAKAGPASAAVKTAKPAKKGSDSRPVALPAASSKGAPARGPAKKLSPSVAGPARTAVVAPPAPIIAPVEPRAPAPRAPRKVSKVPPPQPEVVPTHAPDAAKATFFTMSERVMTPPAPASLQKDPKRANNWKTLALDQLVDQDVLAMPDSEYMNDVQLAFFRRKLQQLKADMLANAGETTEHLREDTVVVPDPADRATIEEEHALELRTRDRERKLLKKIEQAIARIDAGDYGYCEETGEPIGVGRLMARPTASLSLEAQQRRELKQKMFGD